MNKVLYFLLIWGTVLILSACNWNLTPTPNPVISAIPTLSLVVQVQNPTDVFDSVGDVIKYNYIITNTGTGVLAGPVVVTDNIATVTCPELSTIGDQNNTLDPTESITCTGTYSITQEALAARTVTNVATASAAGGSAVSASSGVTVPLTAVTPGKTLGLTKTASPLAYNQAGLLITYSYVITNTGSLAIGPAQFMITDDHINGPFPCNSDVTTILNPGGTLSCTATYTISQQDMGVGSVTNTAIASGGDAQASAFVSATITNSTFPGNITPTFTARPSNLTPGSTISHQVVKGEWLVQIARCYGVEYKNLRNANLQIPNPSLIDPGLVVTVPNIGSAGTIYGPPCVVFHTVVTGDTWNSIATRYNARLDVLQTVNPFGLVTGAQIKVPINSAGAGAAPIPVTGATSTNTPVTATATVTPTFTPTVTSTPITVTPTVGATTPGAGQPTRITFPTGSTSATVSGAVVSHQTVSYVLAANQGQTMTVTLAAAANEIATRIFDPGGILIRPLDGNLTWTGILPATGDYRIDLVGLTDPTKNFSLTVSVTTP
jgi:LysM repeat protein